MSLEHTGLMEKRQNKIIFKSLQQVAIKKIIVKLAAIVSGTKNAQRH
jgi:hypothetical protein